MITPFCFLTLFQEGAAALWRKTAAAAPEIIIIFK
jgi:hypothetical protein